MKNNNKKDNLFTNIISLPDNVNNVSKTAVGKADKDSFCIYNHQRHAVGSVIEKTDGSKYICTEDGSWKNSK